MNKIYRLIPNNNEEWDCFEGFIVVAPNKDVAIKLATNKLYNPELQLPFKDVKEVNLDKIGVVLSAFKAG